MSAIDHDCSLIRTDHPVSTVDEGGTVAVSYEEFAMRTGVSATDNPTRGFAAYFEEPVPAETVARLGRATSPGRGEAGLGFFFVQVDPAVSGW